MVYSEKIFQTKNAQGKKMKDILIKAQLSENERLALAALCDGPCSAEGLADLLGLAHFIQANRLVGLAGHKIHDAAPENSFVRNWHPKEWTDGWFHVVAPGWRSESDKKFYWEIRPEIREAFIALDWYAFAGENERPVQTYEPRLEGAEVLRLLSIRERDPILRAACLAIHGYRCLICGNDLGEIYGEIGKGFIHVHHLQPLAEHKGKQVTDPKENLIPVCPNCHSIMHRGGKTRSPADVRNHLNPQRPISLK
jgi:hypothetical protein